MIRIINHCIIILLILIGSKTNSAGNTCGIPDVLAFGTHQNGTSATPYWNEISGAISYNLKYRIRNVSAPWSSPISTNADSLTLTNLAPASNYEFIVQSVCAADSSAYSASGWFTTANAGTSSSLTRGPYMTVATSSSVTIQWNTSVISNSEVKFGVNLGNQASTSNLAAMTTHHSITLTNLQPNTKYYYSIGEIGTILQGTSENYFYTAPADNDSLPLRFWVTGDFGTGTYSQRAVRDAFVGYTSNSKVNGWLWLGDNAYSNGTDQEYQDHVFDIYPAQFKNIPVFPALGNHDYAQSGYLSNAALGTAFPYFDIFKIPTNSGTEKYYSVNYGNVHLIALDSYGSYNTSTSDMYRWLEDDLINNQQQWTVVYFHHSPYSKGSHDSDNSTEMVDMRNHIIPLLESNGVDLVLSGHSHSYERSYFIKGHFGVSNTFNSSNLVQPGNGPYSKATRTGDGTVYAVCGTSGQVDGSVSGYPHHAMAYSNVSNIGSLILDFTGSSLKGSYLTSTSVILDTFSITKPAIPVLSSTNEIKLQKKVDFQVYPNPAKDEFYVHVNDVSAQSNVIKIINLYGQVVYEKSLEEIKSNSLVKISKSDINNCSPGIYYVSLISDNISSTRSLIVE